MSNQYESTQTDDKLKEKDIEMEGIEMNEIDASNHNEMNDIEMGCIEMNEIINEFDMDVTETDDPQME